MKCAILSDEKAATSHCVRYQIPRRSCRGITAFSARLCGGGSIVDRYRLRHPVSARAAARVGPGRCGGMLPACRCVRRPLPNGHAHAIEFRCRGRRILTRCNPFDGDGRPAGTGVRTVPLAGVGHPATQLRVNRRAVVAPALRRFNKAARGRLWTAPQQQTADCVPFTVRRGVRTADKRGGSAAASIRAAAGDESGRCPNTAR